MSELPPPLSGRNPPCPHLLNVGPKDRDDPTPSRGHFRPTIRRYGAHNGPASDLPVTPEGVRSRNLIKAVIGGDSPFRFYHEAYMPQR
jgi:hypothetical protein